jgi:hypothetical protein
MARTTKATAKSTQKPKRAATTQKTKTMSVQERQKLEAEVIRLHAEKDKIDLLEEKQPKNAAKLYAKRRTFNDKVLKFGAKLADLGANRSTFFIPELMSTDEEIDELEQIIITPKTTAKTSKIVKSEMDKKPDEEKVPESELGNSLKLALGDTALRKESYEFVNRLAELNSGRLTQLAVAGLAHNLLLELDNNFKIIQEKLDNMGRGYSISSAVDEGEKVLICN